MDILNYIWAFIGNNASELIALSALGLAIWQGIAAHNHNKLTVLPHLIFHSTTQCEEPQLAVDLENVGTGPAIINSYRLFLDNEEQDLSNDAVLVDIANKLNIIGIHGGGKIYSKSEALKPGALETVFRITTKYEFDNTFNNVKAYAELQRMQIIVHYESLYGDLRVVKLHNT